MQFCLLQFSLLMQFFFCILLVAAKRNKKLIKTTTDQWLSKPKNWVGGTVKVVLFRAGDVPDDPEFEKKGNNQEQVEELDKSFGKEIHLTCSRHPGS